jgi:hypothetical protein
VADKDRRSTLAMGLFLRLPEFVAAGRHVEAWLLQCSALETTDYQEESNAFLFQMFSYGYDAWTADKRAKDESLFRKLGFDPERLRSMSLDEIDSWIQSQESDPARAGALEALFRENPHLREESVANIEALERDSSRLLERPDSRSLRLPIEETQPWLVLFNERASRHRYFSGMTRGAASEESARKAFEDLVLPLLREMADSVFTRDRIRQLVAELKKYRQERYTAGDMATASHAMGAITYLEREDSPGQNTFLITLCGLSLDSAFKPIEAESAQVAD